MGQRKQEGLFVFGVFNLLLTGAFKLLSEHIQSPYEPAEEPAFMLLQGQHKIFLESFSGRLLSSLKGLSILCLI